MEIIKGIHIDSEGNIAITGRLKGRTSISHTDDNITTEICRERKGGDEYISSMVNNSNWDMKFKFKKIKDLSDKELFPTCKLVEELKRREGVVTHEIGNEEMFRVTTVDFDGNVKHRMGSASPCTILQVID